jgi:hypothetical protein
MLLLPDLVPGTCEEGLVPPSRPGCDDTWGSAHHCQWSPAHLPVHWHSLLPNTPTSPGPGGGAPGTPSPLPLPHLATLGVRPPLYPTPTAGVAGTGATEASPGDFFAGDHWRVRSEEVPVPVHFQPASSSLWFRESGPWEELSAHDLTPQHQPEHPRLHASDGASKREGVACGRPRLEPRGIMMPAVWPATRSDSDAHTAADTRQ